ncbi:MAG TPA: APC family permease [Solirubrobacteraceae bacterium]|nr:APC family permease [Solirubrobacteraceae bacterium]
MAVTSSPGAASAQRDKKMGFVSVLAFAIGAMIGGGVFTLSGIAINHAGPAALVSYAIAGVIMLLSALSTVAVATRAKEGESGYGPVAELLGRPWRFLVMWGFYVNALLAVAFLADSFGAYLHAYFLHDASATAAGVVCLVLLVGLNLAPAVWVGRAESWIVGIKISLLLVFIGWGLAAISPSHFHPFAPHGTHAILSTSELLFTAYIGFNVVTNILPSVRDPAKTAPRAIIAAMLIAIAVYVLVVVAMLDSGITHFGLAGVSQAANVLMGHWGAQMIAVAACLSTLSGANAMVLGGNEIALRLAAHEDIPAFLGKTSKDGFAWVSVGVIGVVALMLVLFANIDRVIVLVNITALAALFIMNMAAFVLARRGFPGAGFRIPGGTLLPIVGGVACLGELFAYDLIDLVTAAATMAFGLALYARRDWRRKLPVEPALEHIREMLRNLETPLARALQHLQLPPHRLSHRSK